MKEYKMNKEKVKKSTQRLMVFVAFGILITAFILGKENLQTGDYYGFLMLMLGEGVIAAFVIGVVYNGIIKKVISLKIIIEDDHFIWIGIDGKSVIVNFEDVVKINEVSRGLFIDTKSKGRLSIPDKLDCFNDMVLILKEKIKK